MDLIIDTFRMSDPDDELYNQNDIWLEDFINEKEGKFEITGTLGLWTGTHEIEPVKLSWTMYLPQVVMLILAFVIGIYMPQGLTQAILATVAGF